MRSGRVPLTSTVPWIQTHTLFPKKPRQELGLCCIIEPITRPEKPHTLMGKCTQTSGPRSDGAHYIKSQEIGLRTWRAEGLAELVGLSEF